MVTHSECQGEIRVIGTVSNTIYFMAFENGWGGHYSTPASRGHMDITGPAIPNFSILKESLET